MTLCILGINVFQGYWLYSTYTLHQQQFSRTALEALLMSLEKRQEADARQLFRGPTSGVSTDTSDRQGKEADRIVYQRFGSEASGPERVFFIEEDHDLFGKEKEDMVHEKTRVNIRTFQRKLSPDSLFKTLPADTLARRLSNRIMYNWVDTPFNLPRMDSAYRAELKLRNVEADFRLDTLRLTYPKADLSALKGKKRRNFRSDSIPFR